MYIYTCIHACEINVITREVMLIDIHAIGLSFYGRVRDFMICTYTCVCVCVFAGSLLSVIIMTSVGICIIVYLLWWLLH